MKLFFSIIISFPVLALYSQSIFLNNGEYYKYYPGTSQPDASWKNINYTASGWSEGYKSIGFGDDDDSTIISPVPSVYLRIEFTVDNTDDFADLNLRVDYDDGFVAYLNGTEVIRVNMGETGSETTYNQLATRSHEAESYRRSFMPVNGYLIPSDAVQSIITTGKNILAVEVHNDSTNGSDLSFNSSLIHIDWDDYFYTNANYRFIHQTMLDSTMLPIFNIETNEYGFQNRWIRYPATMKVIHNENGNYNKPEDTARVYDGKIGIEIRGQSSSEFPKRSFRFETQDPDGSDTSVSILGLPEENDYILFAPFQDKSLIRNPVVYDIGNKFGSWNPHTRLCEVILNGEYIGVYNLIETIKRDKNRINIDKLKSDENSGIDITGGYIMKYDKDASGLIIVYPKKEDLSEEQNSYIRSFMRYYNDILFSDQFLDPVNGYWKYMDPDSYIDYVILCELAKNADAYLYSTYFFKDNDEYDGRIKFGPIWDNDLGFGNSEFQNGHLTNGWQFTEINNRKLNVTRMLQDIDLLQDFQNRWFELRENTLHKDSIYALIDNYTTQLEGAWQRNYDVWPLINVELFFPGYIPYVPDSYEDEIEIMKTWISNRIDWIDENITRIFYEYIEYPPIASPIPEILSDNVNISVFPNPFNDYFTVSFKLENEASVMFELTDIHGRKYVVKGVEMTADGKHTIDIQPGNNLPAGIYMLNMYINGIPAMKNKIIKL